MLFKEREYFICFVVVWVINAVQKTWYVRIVLHIFMDWKGTVPFSAAQNQVILIKRSQETEENVRHTDWPIQNIIKLALKRQHLHYEGERSDCILCTLVMQLVLIRPWDNLALQKMSVCGGCGWDGGTSWCNVAKIISSASHCFLLNYWIYHYFVKCAIFSFKALIHFNFPLD